MVDVAALLDPPTHQRAVRLAHMHGRSLNQREINRFLTFGIRPIALIEPWPVLSDRVVFDGEYFHFADDLALNGEPACTLVVISNEGFMDIVAWNPRTNRLAIWLGEGFALGERLIHHPNPLIDGLQVFRSPVQWLREGRAGIVIVRARFAPQVLSSVPLLIAEDEEHRSELQELFPAGCPRPDVLVKPTFNLSVAEPQQVAS